MAEKNCTCVQCGAGFVSPRKVKYCSGPCKNRAKTLRLKPCAKVKAPNKNARLCKCCGIGFTYHPAGKDKGREHERGLFCSATCKTVDRLAGLPGPSSPVHAFYCIGCGLPFVSRRRKSFCSAACYPVKEYVSIAPAMKACTTCGEAFAPPKAKTRPTDFCSSTCKASAQATSRRIGRSRRRAVERDATVERVDPFKVFDRDRWLCRLCGIKTPKAKRGSFDDDAPELDHIITLSEGGEHSYRNTQCACRKCNGLKAGRSMGQLLLIG